MAATYLTIGSKFQPFSFAEMIQPLQMYGQEYQRQEDLYNTYAETAGLIGAELNPELDSDILNNTYNPYMQALSSGADTLATEGLTPGGRKQLQELRRRFGREITPIKVASEARAKARENWDKMLAQDKTLMTNANPYYKGITAYMNGASPDTTYVSGNELYSRGQNLAEAFSKTMREVPEDERLALQGQYFRIVNQYGANSAEADAFMQGAIDRIPALAKQVDEILANSGIDAKGFTPADKQRARQYIIEGMQAGLSGETKVDYMQNRQWDLDRSKGSGPELPENLPTYTIGMGHVGDGEDYSDIEKFVETLALNGGSVSSTELDRLILQYAQDLETIRKTDSKYGSYSEISNVPSGSLGTPGMTSLSQAMNRSTSTSEGFHGENGFTSIYDLDNDERNAYTKARRNIYGNTPAAENTPHKRMQKIQDQIDELTQKYGHIPGIDAVDSIKRGVALDKAQSSREVTGIVPRVTPSEQKNAVAAILNGIGLSIGTENSKTKGLVDMETGKQLTGNQVSKLIHDNSSSDDRFQVVATDSEPIVIYDKETGKSYAPHGSIFEIDDYRKRFTSINNFLKDFSNSETGISGKKAEISNVGLTMLTEYGLMPSSGGVDLGDGYRGFITYSEDNDVIKVVVKDGPYTGVSKIIGTSSLNDEINQGALRGNFIKDAATGFLHDIFVLNQAK